jgi:hypothetical protein
MTVLLKLPFFTGNSFFSFSSSSLIPDLFNRFGFISSTFYKIFIEFNFKLPLENILSKFKNRIHFVLYYLFFELLVSQKPRILVRRQRLRNLSSFKNKREIKKAKESIGIQTFSFNASLISPEQLNNFLLIISFFVAPFTDRKLNPPSKHVLFSLSESESQKDDMGELLGLVKNLSIFPTFNLIDDLSGFNTELKIKFYSPISEIKDRSASQKTKKHSWLRFVGTAYGISTDHFLNYLNLRSFKL